MKKIERKKIDVQLITCISSQNHHHRRKFSNIQIPHNIGSKNKKMKTNQYRMVYNRLWGKK